ncbi:hypothetical protein J4456_01070 [Candidatus Pacearchaeota archaeon]|nr:hypothetical protein [Candidatus Pacearchaeota archaeon]
MERLYLHRVEPIEKNGQTRLEPIPEKKEQENLGVKYRLAIVKNYDKNAICYGWNTGYRGGGFDETPSPQGEVYSPQGFGKGNLAFVTAYDDLMRISIRDMSSLENFLENLDKIEVEKVINKIQGFTFVGLVE